MLREVTTAVRIAALVGTVCLAACDTVSVGNTGANTQTLCLTDYQQCIDPILHASINGSLGPLTCSASGCHNSTSGSGGGFKLFADPDPADPTFDQQILANFISAKAFANFNSPPDSKLLLEPLRGVFAISGTHTGGDIFPDTADACYVAIRDWISRRVTARDAPSCGGCTPPDVSTCGN